MTIESDNMYIFMTFFLHREPAVGVSGLRHMDEVDSGGHVRRVRPMSAHVSSRKSRLLDSDDSSRYFLCLTEPCVPSDVLS